MATEHCSLAANESKQRKLWHALGTLARTLAPVLTTGIIWCAMLQLADTNNTFLLNNNVLYWKKMKNRVSASGLKLVHQDWS